MTTNLIASRPSPSAATRGLAQRLPLGLSPAQLGSMAAGVVAFAAVVALIAGPTAGLLVIGGVVGLAIAAVAIMVPTVALVIMLAGEFCNVSGVYQGKVPSIYVGFLALAILSTICGLLRPRYRERIRRNWWIPSVLLLVYLVTMVPAMIISDTPAKSAGSLDDWLKNLLMLFVVSLLMQMSDRPWAYAAAIVVPMSVICVMMGLNEYVIGNAFTFGGFSNIASAAGDAIAASRHSGPVPDSNFWGRFLILGLPLALALAHRAWKAGRAGIAAWWLLNVLLLLAGVYLTQSRGTLIAAALALVVWIVAVGPQVRRLAVWLLPLALAGLMLPGIGDRLLTLTSTLTGPSYSADASLVERQNVQTVAVKIFEKNPVFGTGPDSFGYEIGRYAPLTNAGSTGDILATHNLYLQVGSETGVVGLAGWLIFIGGVIALGVRATLRLAGARQDGPGGAPTRALAAATVAGLVGFSAASAFLHLAYARPLLIVCAMAGLLYSTSMADRRLDAPAAAAATRRAVRGLRFGAIASTATAVAAALVAGTLFMTLSRTEYVATADLTLLPTPETYPGYAIDIRRRVIVLPTYAAVIQNSVPQDGTIVGADPARGVMIVTASAPTLDAALARRQAVVDGAQTAIEKNGMAAAYRVVTVAELPVTSSSKLTDTIVRVILIATLIEIIVVIVLCARIRREERRQGIW